MLLSSYMAEKPWQEEEAKQYSEPEDIAYYGLGSRMVGPSRHEFAGHQARPPSCLKARSVLMASIFFLFASCSPLIFAGILACSRGSGGVERLSPASECCARSSPGSISSWHSLCTATFCCSVRARSLIRVEFSGSRLGEKIAES